MIIYLILWQTVHAFGSSKLWSSKIFYLSLWVNPQYQHIQLVSVSFRIYQWNICKFFWLDWYINTSIGSPISTPSPYVKVTKKRTLSILTVNYQRTRLTECQFIFLRISKMKNENFSSFSFFIFVENWKQFWQPIFQNYLFHLFIKMKMKIFGFLCSIYSSAFSFSRHIC